MIMEVPKNLNAINKLWLKIKYFLFILIKNFEKEQLKCNYFPGFN